MPEQSHWKRASLIVNTASRRGARAFKRVQAELREAGFAVTPYALTNPDDLTPLVKKLIDAGEKLLIVGGGDGTISEIVDQLVYSDVVLGILPLGTANSFSRSLDIPTNLSQAIKVIAGGKTAQIDLGKINGDYFANAASIGYASSIAQDIPTKLKKRFGIFAYAIQGVRNVRKLKPFLVTLEQGTKKESVQTYQVVIANGGFYGPASLVSKSRLQSADLSIFTFKNAGPLRMANSWVRSVMGIALSQQGMQRIEVVNEVTLHTVPTQRVSIDGEIKTETPIRISVAPRALTILVAGTSKLHP